MKFFAVTGHPVLDSRSPAIFNPLFSSRGVDAIYMRLGAASAGDALALARRVGLTAFNVTSPFKEEMYRLGARGDDLSRRLRAANIVRLDRDGTSVFNTDPDGVEHALRAGAIDARGQDVVVVGAGGAARAAALALVAAGARVVVTSRTTSRAAEVAAGLGCGWRELGDLPNLLAGAAGLVCCLPAGVDIVDESWLHARLWVLDANYRGSALADKARRRGGVVLDGLDWLIGQAASAHRIFAGDDQVQVKPDPTAPDRIRVKPDLADSDAPTGPEALAVEIARFLAHDDGATTRGGVALAGMMGSGKSVVGAAVARRLGRRFVDTDQLIVEGSGHDIPWLFANRGEEGFRRVEAETIARVVEAGRAVIALGGGSLGDPDTVRRVRRSCRIVWLWASPPCLARRTVSDGRGRPLLGGGSREPRLAELLVARTRSYASASDLVVDAERTVEEIVDLIEFEMGRCAPSA